MALDSGSLIGASEPAVLPRPASDVRVRLVRLVGHPAAIPILVAMLTAAAFAGSLWNGFVDWDDQILIGRNEAYRGLGWTHVSWMFTNVMMGHYVPLTWLTLGLDYVLWGMRPAGYHLTNLVLHAANAALFYLVALRLLAASTRFTPGLRRLAATAATVFFAIHPLRAESVAWVTERRDVLSGLFFFLTILLYLAAVRPDLGSGHDASPGDVRDSRRRYWRLHAFAWCMYLLAIFSKSIVMTLPAILVLLDVYPLRRLGTDWRAWWRPSGWPVWREKIPYAALGLLAAMLGYYGQAMNGFFTSTAIVPWTVRPSLVLYSVWFYASKTALPLRLAPLYELPARIDPLAIEFAAPAGVVLVTSVLLLVLRRRWPAGLAAAGAYVVLLAPVAGLTHSGFQLAHDRYSYLSCLAWALLVGAGVAVLVRAGRDGIVRPVVANAAMAAVAAWFVGMAVLTWQQVEVWRDTDTLWLAAEQSEPECSLCRYHVGALAFNAGLHERARDRFQMMLETRPDRAEGNAHLGLSLAALGDTEQAIAAYRRALETNPTDALTRNNLALALQYSGKRREALVEFEHALRLAPRDATVHVNTGLFLAEQGDDERAVTHFRSAVDLKPDMTRARFELARGLLSLGDTESARVEYERVRQADPGLGSILGPAFLETW
jgi:Flp pilus assembly protein TadD